MLEWQVSMRFWLIKLEEDLPIDADFYPYRMTMLADCLIENGHEVVRWASDFNHKRGTPRFNKRSTINIAPSYRIELLHNRLQYRGSHSIKRIFSIYLQSFDLFVKFFRANSLPDAMIVSMPSPVTCVVVAIFCRIRKIPFFIDARDMWPNIIFEELTGLKKIMYSPLYMLMRFELTLSCKLAHGLVGITPPFMTFLLNYANRKKCDHDGQFPIGFRKTTYTFDQVDEVKFWQKHGLKFECNEKIIYFAGTLNKTVLAEAEKVAVAMAQADKLGLKIKLVMCGSGNSENEIKNLFKGLVNVVFPGQVGASRLAFLKSKSSLALLAIEARPDYLNSLSNKFFDYASGGLPIVTNLKGLPRAVLEKYDAGFFYETPIDLFNIFSLLFNCPHQVSVRAENTKRMFSSEFDADKVYSDFVKHLEKSLRP